jgi:hypothetical protein
MQAPPLQRLPVPQGVPFGAFPDSRHTGAPLLQTVMPVRHGFPATVQGDPGTHDTHEPEGPQTMSFPQAVPAAMFMAVSVHCDVVAEQTRTPL